MTLRIQLVYRGAPQELLLDGSASVAELRSAAATELAVPLANLKLLPRRGLRLDASDSRSLSDLGVADAERIVALGPRAEELEREHAAEEEKRRREAPRNYHPSMLRGTKPRSTATAAPPPPFASIVPHPQTAPDSPQGQRVLAVLHRLAADSGVVHVCRLHDFTVGILTELLPHENPELLGLNENAGQRISLRIRTDDGVGFRSYLDVRRVLLHELAHNHVSGHPRAFKVLNSQLNAELEAYERAGKEGTRTLIEGEAYEPAAAPDAGPATSHVLGGATAGGKDRREVVLEATMRRLEAAEREIERGCGGQ